MEGQRCRGASRGSLTRTWAETKIRKKWEEDWKRCREHDKKERGGKQVFLEFSPRLSMNYQYCRTFCNDIFLFSDQLTRLSWHVSGFEFLIANYSIYIVCDNALFPGNNNRIYIMARRIVENFYRRSISSIETSTSRFYQIEFIFPSPRTKRSRLRLIEWRFHPSFSEIVFSLTREGERNIIPDLAAGHLRKLIVLVTNSPDRVQVASIESTTFPSKKEEKKTSNYRTRVQKHPMKRWKSAFQISISIIFRIPLRAILLRD